MMAVNRLLNLPWRLSKEQLAWLRNRTKDRRPEVRALAQHIYENALSAQRAVCRRG